MDQALRKLRRRRLAAGSVRRSTSAPPTPVRRCAGIEVAAPSWKSERSRFYFASRRAHRGRGSHDRPILYGTLRRRIGTDLRPASARAAGRLEVIPLPRPFASSWDPGAVSVIIDQRGPAMGSKQLATRRYLLFSGSQQPEVKRLHAQPYKAAAADSTYGLVMVRRPRSHSRTSGTVQEACERRAGEAVILVPRSILPFFILKAYVQRRVVGEPVPHFLGLMFNQTSLFLYGCAAAKVAGSGRCDWYEVDPKRRQSISRRPSISKPQRSVADPVAPSSRHFDLRLGRRWSSRAHEGWFGHQLRPWQISMSKTRMARFDRSRRGCEWWRVLPGLGSTCPVADGRQSWLLKLPASAVNVRGKGRRTPRRSTDWPGMARLAVKPKKYQKSKFRRVVILMAHTRFGRGKRARSGSGLHVLFIRFDWKGPGPRR